MKKAFYLLIAAATLMTVASCVKDQFESIRSESSVGQTEFTVSLAPDTRTDLNEEGKTVWAEGDTLWVTNGVGVDKIGVSEDAWGTQEFSIKTDKATPTVDNPTVYIVYPYDSGSKVDETGKVVVKVPGVQDGTFASANICAGVSEGQSVALRNVTAIMKVTVPAETPAPIYQLVFTAAGEGAALSGDVAVDFSGENPVITAENTSASVVTNVGGVDGAIYTAVIPGKYEAGFKLTAATIDFEHATQTKATTAANDVKINEIVDLGSIGTDLQPLGGNGSKGNPFQIENLAHLIALSAAVDNNYEDVKGFEGQYFKVMNDLSGVTTPIGSYEHPFCGNFDGNNKSIIVNLGGTTDYVGLFARLANGANIHNLVVEGNIDVNGNYVGAIVGAVDCPVTEPRVIIKDVVNLAKVKGLTKVGGIAGYADYCDITDCSNNAAIEANNQVGGIVGYAYEVVATSCLNTKPVKAKTDGGRVIIFPINTWNNAMAYLNGSSQQKYNNLSPNANGVGGIAGWFQNSTADACVNSGNIEGVSKAGGIAGSMHWSTARYCTNKAEVFVTGDFVGGVVGWLYVSGNALENTNSGTVIGRAAVGGIVGMANGGTSNAVIKVTGCTNTKAAQIISDYKTATAIKIYNNNIDGEVSAAGGIVGLIIEVPNGSNRGVTQILECVNDGSVSGKGSAVGGICGLRAPVNNNVQTGFIDNCVNNGDVESQLYRAAGILGQCWDRFTSEYFPVRNCANHGTIKAPYVVAGIVSWMGHLYPDANSDKNREQIINCYNDGTILYDATAYSKNGGPYVGGIAGYTRAFSSYNCINYGEIKTYKGDVNDYDSFCAGTVLGFVRERSAFDYLYGPDGDLPLVGTSDGTQTPVAIRGTNTAVILEDGTFDKPVTIGGMPCNNPVDALNNWIINVAPDVTSGIKYNEWVLGVNGPVFAE